MGMRRAAAGVGVAAVALTMTFMTPAHGAEVSHSTSSYHFTSACARWDNPDPAPGTSEWVDICGDRGSYESQSTSVQSYGQLVDQNQSSSPDRYSIDARRMVCSTSGAWCTSEAYTEYDLSPQQVDIDIDTGIARLRHVIDDCAIDITITATADNSYGSEVPQWNGIYYYPLSSVSSSVYSNSGRQRYGSASGTACDWEDLIVGSGAGWISQGDHSSDNFSFYGGV